jgi:transposase
VLTKYNQKSRLFTDEEDKIIINLKYVNGKSMKEIANMMGYKESQIISRVNTLTSHHEWAKKFHLMHLEVKKKAKEMKEKKIIMMLKQGASVKTITKTLNVAPSTVNNLKRRIAHDDRRSD